MSTRSGETIGPVPNGSSIANVLRVFREPSEEDKPYVPLVGGTRLFVLLLYATVLIATSLEFFGDMNVWYGSWELYNTYVFTVSGIFVLLGMVMLLSSRRTKIPDTVNT